MQIEIHLFLSVALILFNSFLSIILKKYKQNIMEDILKIILKKTGNPISVKFVTLRSIAPISIGLIIGNSVMSNFKTVFIR